MPYHHHHRMVRGTHAAVLLVESSVYSAFSLMSVKRVTRFGKVANRLHPTLSPRRQGRNHRAVGDGETANPDELAGQTQPTNRLHHTTPPELFFH